MQTIYHQQDIITYFLNHCVTWIQAEQLAESSSYYGLQGYLATILSDEENQIAAEQSGGAGWIGASDQDVEGQWNWVLDQKLE